MEKQRNIIAVGKIADQMGVSVRTVRGWTDILIKNGHARRIGGGAVRGRYIYYSTSIPFLRIRNAIPITVRENATYVNGRGWYVGEEKIGKNMNDAYDYLIREGIVQ